MAITSFPFDGQAVSESQYSYLFRELQTSGVASSADAAGFRVTAAGTNMNVTVQPGFALLRGHAVQSTAVETLTLPSADTAARTDAIVLRLDPAANSITLAVLKGTPGSASPNPTQTDTGIFEIRLAWVSVGANATTISAANVTEARQFVGTYVGTWWQSTRPAAPRLGTLGYNRTSSTWEFWTGMAWTSLAPALSWSAVTGKPATFTPTPHGHKWADISDPPSSLPPAAHKHAWKDITGAPSTYAPSSHSHAWSSITSRPSTFPPASHSHSSYLESGDTISWANGSKKPHSNSVSGSGTYYAVWVEGNGTFARNTSSIRFKQNVRDIDVDPAAVLSLRPRVYDRKPKEEGADADYRRDEYGLIAEEVHEHLPEIVNYDEDGQIDGLRYDLLGVALLPVVQDQERRIKALEERLERLVA
ncbi:tail fiber domain-containing protein [Streptomyces sp. DT117]|uniref:tail fiber domain-containing protein n=1 Tax=Streptomyces sp. DT117 TaxID=3393422 RepID=UPI003CF8228C